ncbi:2-oxo-4-hydroxy-4-carboxy-5-ureidoimidazoline decarboxylase [Paraglaciecola aquimarina]|uniref:2-oxo-4-hydroxy-4-carboxy-5-ureidoimidazoline decarboxylase n=1 Tax=Paraglaciecola algarum TaxID=3050085 RepID=A0ABS9D9P3_9ALTE|nr:2-oxo-4-hydroxy-4-carboxy-5-ureidoimidazoline decarboxylase [Paraglaciecola sp. G1-23]MCF2948712.1 2-oxo-4-hydroxy-4-carboxy-5-ureidoimidazoline decarboxylase [Paraglaciecola sp. G1-23]
MTLQEFNQLPLPARVQQLHDCCHCHWWAETLAQDAPFNSLQSLLEQAVNLFNQANESQILEAFKGHAKIGDIELLRSKFAGKATAEQGQVMQASEDTIKALWQLNQDYEAKNGFIFIVCATGKSAEEMLVILESRIANSRDCELKNGAQEQNKITQIRLTQLIEN